MSSNERLIKVKYKEAMQSPAPRVKGLDRGDKYIPIGDSGYFKNYKTNS